MTANRILVAATDSAIADLIRICLSSAGYAVTVARDGSEAVSAAERRGPFAAAVLDNSLSGRSACEVLTDLRARGDTTPVVIVSGWLRDSELPAGGDPVRLIAKPFRAAGLVAAVNDLVAGNDSVAVVVREHGHGAE